MMPEYFQTCICCDDPIEVHGFHLHVCDQCRREMGDENRIKEPVFACCLYQEDAVEVSGSRGAR